MSNEQSKDVKRKQEAMLLIEDVRGLLSDRLDAVGASGKPILEVLEELTALIKG